MLNLRFLLRLFVNRAPEQFKSQPSLNMNAWMLAQVNTFLQQPEGSSPENVMWTGQTMRAKRYQTGPHQILHQCHDLISTYAPHQILKSQC